MSEYLELGNINDFAVGRARVLTVGERRIALYRTAKGFFATDNTCPHRGGPLGEGDLIGDEIVCPWHLWSFNVQTGITEITADVCLVMHDVMIEGETILVRLNPAPQPVDELT